MQQNDQRMNQQCLNRNIEKTQSAASKPLFRKQGVSQQMQQQQPFSGQLTKKHPSIHTMRQSQIASTSPQGRRYDQSSTDKYSVSSSIQQHQLHSKHIGTPSEQPMTLRTPNTGLTTIQKQPPTATGHQPQDTSHDADIVSVDQGVIADDAASANKLVPLEINFLLNENREAHHTTDYDYPYLILRRGQPFFVSVRFDKAFNASNYILTLQFTLGSQSLISKGTHIRIPVNGTQTPVSGWKADFVRTETTGSKNIVKIEVNTSPTALIGRYKVYLETQFRNEKPCLFRYAEDVPLIMNPFCIEDSCYMSNLEDLNEYVFNEDGVLYIGTEQNIVSRCWYFGQFQFPCLDIALWLMERANLPFESRGNVYHIMRSLAAMINGGDRGMLESVKPASLNRQGFDPNEWIGSVKIAKKFMEQRGQPVRFGCSWTFSAVLCTLARSLGIPCRVVTAFNTAHDCDLCSTIDIHWDRNHRPVIQLNKDSINISHTWNEVWFKRDDIPTELNGWQVVDCSGVSASESLYRLGPYPVKAIKNGDSSFISDGHAFLSMTNNYIVHWIAERNGDMLPMSVEDNYFANKIVTKSIDSNQYVDIANTYKGDHALHCNQWIEERRLRLTEHYKILQSSFDVESKVYMMQECSHGDTILLTWSVQNQSNEIRTCEFYMNAYFATVDGKLITECKELRGDILTLNAKEERQHHMKIRAEDYLEKIRPSYMLKIYSQLHVVETGQVKPIIYSFDFESYDLIRIIQDKNKIACVDQTFPIKIQISNPLKRLLQNCTLHIEGIGTPRTIILERALRPLEVTVYQTSIIPNKAGTKQLYIGFSCSLLNNIYTTTKIDVQESSGNEDEDDAVTEKRVESSD